ncbi:TMED1 protein, partial [Todus mexicanus]|nr:TMED1 protein [Todus mexicanus]
MAAPGLLLLLLLGVPGAAAAAAAPPPPPPPDAEVTFVLPAGRRECFYQGAPANASMEAEYQVIGGAGLDVDFSLESPSGRLLVSERRRSDGAHTVTSWGNRPNWGWRPGEANRPRSPRSPPSRPQESIETMRSRLERSIQMQTLLRAFEARDRNLQESNLGRVNFWSAVNLALLLVVAFLQVYLLKSLFEDKRTVRT